MAIMPMRTTKGLIFILISSVGAFHSHSPFSKCRVERRARDVSSTSRQSRWRLGDGISRWGDMDEASLESDQSTAGEHSRRDFVATGISAAMLLGGSSQALAETTPSLRPTAYRVDSTIPPTLLPLRGASAENKILRELGKGSGTDKQEVVVDTINFNNILNRAVFGTIDRVSAVTTGSGSAEKKRGTGYATFVCLGVPNDCASTDVDLALGLLDPMIQSRKSVKAASALGLAFCPYSTQAALDRYAAGGNEAGLVETLTQAGVSETTVNLYLPLFRFAQSNSLDLLAMAPEVEDAVAVRSQGLQNVNPERRAEYVVDPQGFIALPQDPKFKVYTDRSLIKDFEPENAKDSFANFFSERILVHEAAATAAAKYAASRPESFVALVGPIRDVRFLGGFNGRIPRIFASLNKESKVTDNAVTTILLNPTAKDTLSKTRYLRLEIGTAPDVLDYQTKVADYIWFSSSPKVNLLPRLMNG